MLDLLNTLVSTSFIPHGHCYLWQPGLVWLHLTSDALTAIAYYSVAFAIPTVKRPTAIQLDCSIKWRSCGAADTSRLKDLGGRRRKLEVDALRHANTSYARIRSYLIHDPKINAEKRFNPKNLAKAFAAQPTADVSLEDAIATVCQAARALPIEFAQLLAVLFPAEQLLDAMLDTDALVHPESADGWQQLNHLEATYLLTHALRWCIISYLIATEFEALRQRIQPLLSTVEYPKAEKQSPSIVFYLAACLGFHQELLAVVECWADDRFSQHLYDLYQRPQELVLGLGNAQLVESHMRRLQLGLEIWRQYQVPIDYVRAWLACTEYAALDYIRDGILRAYRTESAIAMTENLGRVKAPEVAQLMLELQQASKPQPARHWLEENPTLAIAGLIPVAAGTGQLADAAIHFLLGADMKPKVKDESGKLAIAWKTA